MTDVGTVIDLAGRQVVFGKLNATAPLLMINGHIAIDVMQFKVFEHVHLWHSFSKELQVKGMTTEYAPLLPDQALDDDVCDALVSPCRWTVLLLRNGFGAGATWSSGPWSGHAAPRDSC